LDNVQYNWTVYSLSMPRTRGPGQRAGLDRATVIDAARAVLTDAGYAGLTMRGLAGRLGVAPNALYSHVGGKTELVDLVLDDVLGEVTVPDEVSVHRDPLAAVRSIMTASFDVLLAHTDLMPHFLARQGARGEHAVRLGEVTLDALVRAGVESGDADETLRVLIVTTVGFAAFAPADGPLPADEIRASYLRALDWLLASAVNDR
jgi:TetR/AcrR family transcriptional regulator, tetracycline repressor protein